MENQELTFFKMASSFFNFEVIGILFIFLMCYVSFYFFKRKQISLIGFYFWIGVWLLGLILVIFHPFFNAVLDPLSITRVFDLYTILGFMFFFFMVFYLFKIIKSTEKKLEDLTRSLALKGLTENGKANGKNKK